MSEPVVRILLLNAAFVLLGLGLMPLLGIAGNLSELAGRSGLSYLLGVAVAGIVGTDLPIVGVAFSLPLLALLVVAVLAAGAARLRVTMRAEASSPARPIFEVPRRPGFYAGLALATAGFGTLAILLVHAGRAFVIHPLGWVSNPPISDYDSWAIWALKARALLQLGDVHNGVFTSHAYALSHLDYPLAFASVQALDYRAMGGFLPTPMHLQLVLLALGFVAALISLLRGRTSMTLLAAALLLLFAATMPLMQLETAYADMPLAFMIATGVAGLARYILTGERFALHAAIVLLGAGALTKNEGALFALCAFVAACIAVSFCDRRRLYAVAIGAILVFAIILPWRLWVATHPAPGDYRFSNLLDPSYLSAHADHVRMSFDKLRQQLGVGAWGSFPALLAVGAVCAALARRFAFLTFAVSFLMLSLAGLITTYWVSTTDLGFLLATSSYRVIDTVVVSGVVLAAIGAGEAWRLVTLPSGDAGGKVAPALAD